VQLSNNMVASIHHHFSILKFFKYEYCFRQIDTTLWNFRRNAYYCVFVFGLLDTFNLVWCVLLILRWFEYLWGVMSLFLDCDCFLDIKYWCMNYVWVCVNSFELIHSLNKVCEINKIRVDFWCCSFQVDEWYFVLN